MNASMTCPSTPNCVSSMEARGAHFIDPLHFSGSPQEAQQHLLSVLDQFDRVRVVRIEENQIRAEAISRVLGFVDDLHFRVDAGQGVIHVKSAARSGYFDLGVNRRRVEKIRSRFDERRRPKTA